MLTLSGCTGGDVKVSSLGLTLEKVLLTQNHSNRNFLEVNKDSQILRFKLVCSEDYSSVELRLKGHGDWFKGTPVNCKQPDTFFSIDLKSLGITLSEGLLNALEFRFVSEKGYSDPVEHDIVISQYVPTTASAAIQDFSGYINTLDVKLNVSVQYSYTNGQSHEASEMYLTDTPGCATGGTWQSFQMTPSWTLKKTNDTNTVYMKFRDAGLTESNCVSAATYHDSVAPAASILSFIGFPSPNLTNLNEISLSILANGDPFEMKISNSPVCLGGDWESYTTQKDHWSVPNLNSMNSISIKFRDRAHNESACLTANYTHDNTPPSVPVMTLINGTNPGQMTGPGFQIAGLSIGDQFELYGEGTCTTPLMIQNLATTATFFFPALTIDGTYQYFTRIRDAATNWLECQGPLYTYKLDRLAPTAASSGHPTTVSNIANWTETFSGADVHEYKYKIGTTPTTTCSNKTIGYSSWILKSSTPTAALDISALVDGSITLCVYGRDQALNEQSVPTSYSWTKNTSSLQASFQLSSLPAPISNVTALNIKVEGYLIDQYKSKVGSSGSTDCTLSTGYSASWIGVGTNITTSVAGYAHNSTVRICVIGRNSGSLTEQPLSLETKFDFTRDTQPAKVVTVDFPTAGDYLVGDDLIIGLNFDEEVVIDPTISGLRQMDIKLNGGSTTKNAVYYRKISATKLEFIYKVLSGDVGNFGYSTQLSLPTSGFIKDRAGNSLNSSSGLLAIGNLANSSVQVYNQNPMVSISWDANEVFDEANNQVSFRISIPTAIDTDLNFSYFADVYTLDGLNKLTWNLSDTIPKGQTSKLVSFSGINNSTIDGMRGLGIDLRKINHGYFGNKTLYGGITDDETRAISGVATDIALGNNDACILTSIGHVYCFGIGNYGELGLGTNVESRASPQRLTTLNGVTKIYTVDDMNGYYCAKAADGIYCWGHSGDYATGAGTSTNQLTPYKHTTLGSNPEIIRMSDMQLTCSRDSLAGTKCWGENTAGLAGTGATASNILVPTTVVPAIANFRKSVENMGTSTSSMARCALINDGNTADGSPAYCWGDSSMNGLGTGLTRTPTLLMASQVMDIETPTRGFCAWGDFDTGKPGYEISCWGVGASSTYVLGFTGVTVTTPQEILGFNHTQKFYVRELYGCSVGDYDSGTSGLEIMCWGSNSYGRLGNGTTNTSSTTPGAPLTGVSINNVNDIKLGPNSACAKKTDGSLWCWGSGFTTAPSQQVTAGFNDFEMGATYVLVRTATNGLQCYGSCTNYIRQANLPTAGVTKVVMNMSGSTFCYIASGSVACLGNYNTSRFNLGTLTLTENTQTYTGSELSKILDESHLCFNFTGPYYSCRAYTQYSLGKPGGASYTGLIESRLPVSAKKISLSPYYHAFVDDLDNLIQVNATNSINLSIFGIGPNFISVNNAKFYSAGHVAVLSDGFYPYTTSSQMIGKQTVNFEAANAQNNGSAHYCYPVAGTARCAATATASGYSYGQLGDNNTTTGAINVVRTPLVDVGQELTDIAETATGGNRSCARTHGNELYCWGTNIDSGGTTNAPMARLLVVGVTQVKLDYSGRIYIKKSDNKVYAAAANTISFTEKFSGVLDFWGSSEGLCVKKTDTHFYCLPETGFDLSSFGRFFDRFPYAVY